MEQRKTNSLKRYKAMHSRVLESNSTNQIEKFILPDKILFTVFRYLKQKDILLNVAQVNRHFYKVAQEPGLYKSIALGKIDENSLGHVEKFLKNTSNLQELILYRYFDRQEQLITLALQNNKGLKKIQFHDRVSNGIAQALVDHGQHIEHLDFQGLDGLHTKTHMTTYDQVEKSEII